MDVFFENDSEMDFLRNEAGDICELPDDGFEFFGVSVESWVNKIPPSGIQTKDFQLKRLCTAARAKQMASKHWAKWDYSGVIEHYRIDKKNGSINELDLYFVFKKSNNGDTIVIKNKYLYSLI